MPLIPYPNVPNVPGVPQVLRQFPAGPPPVLGTAVGIAALARSFFSKPKWGIYRAGALAAARIPPTPGEITVQAPLIPVVIPDSIRDFGYTQGWEVTTAPVQNGGFSDFNRVATPFEATIRMTKGGSEQNRADFLKQIEALGTTALYDILTPEKTYLNCNLLRVELSRRGEKGAFWFPEVDVIFREIRVTNSQYIHTSIVSPQSASSANPQNNGTQQGTTVTTPPPVTVTQ